MEKQTMKHDKWLTTLLGAALVLCPGARAEDPPGEGGQTIGYGGDPDHPFPGAWGDPDIECAEWDSAEESDCWKCEGSSPPEPVPKFGWTLTTQDPSFEFVEPEEINLCIEEGRGEVVTSSAPAYTVMLGQRAYTPTIAACGTESNIPINVASIEWTWAVVGCDTLRSGETGAGDSAYAMFVASPNNHSFSITSDFLIPRENEMAQIAGQASW
jgi:hypothetical protein